MTKAQKRKHDRMIKTEAEKMAWKLFQENTEAMLGDAPFMMALQQDYLEQMGEVDKVSRTAPPAYAY